MSQTPLGFQSHNHDRCLHEALQAARLLCQQQGLRLTPIREQVLTIIWQSHQPLGAYEILEQLAEQLDQRSKLAPPTVYRALDFLQQHGLVHRIASLNAYMGCCSPDHPHHSQFLICQQCKRTVELAEPAISDSIDRAARQAGFLVAAEHIEILGSCPSCQQEPAA
jgi:Fur family zinc uptake transcriptional regulator